MCDSGEEPRESLLIVGLGGGGSGAAAIAAHSVSLSAEKPLALNPEDSLRVVNTAFALGALGEARVDAYIVGARKAAQSTEPADWDHVRDMESTALTLSAENPRMAWASSLVEVAFGSAIVKFHNLTTSACDAAEQAMYGPAGKALGYCVAAAVRANISGSIALTSVVRVPTRTFAAGFQALPPPAMVDVAQTTDVLVLSSDGRFADPATGSELVQQLAEATRRCVYEIHGEVPLVRCLYQVRTELACRASWSCAPVLLVCRPPKRYI